MICSATPQKALLLPAVFFNLTGQYGSTFNPTPANESITRIWVTESRAVAHVVLLSSQAVRLSPGAAFEYLSTNLRVENALQSVQCVVDCNHLPMPPLPSAARP
jgi:hypothetical protein